MPFNARSEVGHHGRRGARILDEDEMETPLPGEWYWGIVCPLCERYCPMYRDVTQGTVETTVLSAKPGAGRIRGLCPHCQTSFDVPAERFHHFQVPERLYD